MDTTCVCSGALSIAAFRLSNRTYTLTHAQTSVHELLYEIFAEVNANLRNLQHDSD